ncbi:MAG: hypothetical protein J2P17_00810 [Mycobacterium sp.]|nr:hypothetical protein [Mycobacterium sp.]
MANWAEIATPIATFVSGGAGIELFRFWRARERSAAENQRDVAAADSAIVSAAVQLLDPYRKEVADLREDIASVRNELEKDRLEHTRVTGLLQQAIAVIRDFLNVAREHAWPAPDMSPELLAEIDKAA